MPAKLTNQQFITKANAIHNYVYDYSDVDYVHGKQPVIIKCHIHGEFQQKPYNHLTLKRGCPECGKQYASQLKRDTKKTRSEFINHANNVHQHKYTYDKLTYVSMHNNVVVTCPQHGDFTQLAQTHYTGSGCPQCAAITRRNIRSLSCDQFVENSRNVHGNKYNYDAVEYVNSTSKVSIVCPRHGRFDQLPKNHTHNSTGCPTCGAEHRASVTTSVGEQQVSDFCSQFTDVIQNTRSLIPPLEIDIFLPEYNLAIEYCGLYWHSEQKGKHRNYHAYKNQLCNSKGIRLLTIFDDEWKQRQHQVENKIKMLIDACTMKRVYARNTHVRPISNEEKRHFFDHNHIQGNGPSSINVGLFHVEELVAAVGFIKQHNRFYLSRYATTHHVIGGFSKLVNHFKSTYCWSQIVSFADNRWSNGNMYITNGWTLDCEIPPDYYYSLNGASRIHKFNFRRKNLPKILKHFNPTLSERQNCDTNGVLRIWDCGKLRFVLNNPHPPTNSC